MGRTVIVAALLLAACSRTVDGHPEAVRLLSHAAVERYIETRLQVTGVVCNDGRDFPMIRDGASFACTDGGGGRRFTVTVTDMRLGRYVVS